tara:strand:- start:110 stop:649 length:540 start_codon:yes stop_codon:yes gene_type:complete
MNINRSIIKPVKWLIFFIVFFSLSNCGIYKPVDARKIPPNDEARIKKNQEEGRGFTLGGMSKTFGSGGTFQFSSSNEMWRATIEILDFLPLADVDYGGGIIITEWYSAPQKPDESLKIMVQFLSNEIRADGIKVNVYKKECKTETQCSASLIESDIGSEIKLEILKQATLLKKADLKNN